MDYATGAMGGLVSKLGMLLKEEYDLQKSVKGGIKFLMAELESMQVALEKVSGVPADQVDKETRLWARDVREMSYDIEDSLDTFLVRVEGKKKSDKPHGLTGFIDRSLNSLSKAKIRHRLATNIENIKGRVKEAKERRDRYNVGKIVVKPEVTSSSIDPRLPAMYKKATELVGIDKAMDELISMLSNGIEDKDLSRKRLKTVSVVGFGGLGKTILAKTVYERVNKDFKCNAFVSVGQNPDIKKVLKDILLELDHQEFRDIHNTIRDEKQLIDLLRRYLDDKSICRPLPTSPPPTPPLPTSPPPEGTARNARAAPHDSGGGALCPGAGASTPSPTSLPNLPPPPPTLPPLRRRTAAAGADSGPRVAGSGPRGPRPSSPEMICNGDRRSQGAGSWPLPAGSMALAAGGARPILPGVGQRALLQRQITAPGGHDLDPWAPDGDGGVGAGHLDKPSNPSSHEVVAWMNPASGTRLETTPLPGGPQAGSDIHIKGRRARIWRPSPQHACDE